MARHDSSPIIKFANDTTVVGLITDNDETVPGQQPLPQSVQDKGADRGLCFRPLLLAVYYLCIATLQITSINLYTHIDSVLVPPVYSLHIDSVPVTPV